MAFSDFKYPDVYAQLGLTEGSADLFPDVAPVPAGPVGQTVGLVGARLGEMAHTEASRAIWMVGPVLADFWARYNGRINLTAGAEFAPDPDNGLSGYCDFLIGRAPHVPRVTAPVVVIFEAKRNAIVDGYGQCIAGMVGVQRFNRRDGREVDPVYGCSTTGSQWRFLALSGTTVTLDLAEYSIHDVDKLLGILTHMIGPPAALR